MIKNSIIKIHIEELLGLIKTSLFLIRQLTAMGILFVMVKGEFQ